MSVRDHSEIVITAFRGIFDRNEDDTTPVGFFLSAQNNQFIRGGITIRPGTKVSFVKPAIRRMAVYKREGEAQRLLVLNNSGQIYDSINGTLVLSIAGMTDFSTVTIFNRAYITPHNGKTGLAGQSVYVYEGSGPARLAGGVGPSAGTLTVANSALSGRCETGVHIFAVAYETVTGYISKYGYFLQFSPVGERKLDISNIPIGPAGTVARHLLATKEILNFNGDVENQTYYFIPNGRVAGNEITTHTVDFYDAELMDEASYLFEQAQTIPAGVGIGSYRGHMITWGEDLHSSVVRVSKSGEPESFNEIEGFLTVNPGDAGGGVKNCFTYRNQLIICKSQRTYSTQDNDEEAAFWEVGDIDAAIGTECHGVGRSLDFGESVEERVVIADRAGLRLFVGAYSDEFVLSFNVDDIWGRITQTAFHTIEVALDPIENRIYVALPLDGAILPSHVLYCDYTEGVSADFLRFDLWKFPKAPTTVVIDVVNAITVFKYGSLDGDVHEADDDLVADETTELSNAIEQFIEFPFIPVGDLDEGLNHYTGIRARVRGEGVLDISMKGLDNVRTASAPSLVLSPVPGYPLFRGFNFTSEHCAIKLRLFSAGSYFTITKFILYLTPVWEERPVLG